jgi:hypothetical protein
MRRGGRRCWHRRSYRPAYARWIGAKAAEAAARAAEAAQAAVRIEPRLEAESVIVARLGRAGADGLARLIEALVRRRRRRRHRRLRRIWRRRRRWWRGRWRPWRRWRQAMGRARREGAKAAEAAACAAEAAQAAERIEPRLVAEHVIVARLGRAGADGLPGSAHALRLGRRWGGRGRRRRHVGSQRGDTRRVDRGRWARQGGHGRRRFSGRRR